MELEVNNNETLTEKQSVKESEGLSNSDNNKPDDSPVDRTITVTDPEEWLCVAKLPLDTTEETFHDLLSDFGCVKDSFLLVSSRTGLFKGYGFACFTSKVAALQARHVLDGQEVDGHLVDCGWLKEGTHHLSDLHSKVLYVDKLPIGFRDLAQFRKLFSKIVNPPYCQIAQKNGVLQDWGLVEFNTTEEAENTMESCRDAQLDDIPIRVQYCIPNIHAINIYMSFVNNPMERVEKKALMDETPSKDVYHQLQSLSKQNPWFVQSLQSIMTQNILADDHPPQVTPAQTPQSPNPDITSCDPSNANSSNHAVLALLLAAYLKPNQGVQQGAASLGSLIKQLEAGTSAVELLKNALVPSLAKPSQPLVTGDGRAPLLPNPPSQPQSGDLSSLISTMTNLVSQGKLPTQAPSSVTPNTKNPQLMNMLYSAFQARMSKMQGNNGDPEASPPATASSSPSPAAEPPPAEVATPPAAAAPPPAGAEPPPPQAAPAALMPTPPGYPVAAPQYMYPGVPGHHYQPMSPFVQTVPPPDPPVSSQAKNMNQFLSLPPPPPPPDHSWQYMPAPGPGLLYSPVMPQAAPMWPHQQIFIHPQQSQKRKMEEFMSIQPQVAAFPEVDNQPGIKRQKLCGGN